jgi:hypothetical protein
MENKMAIDLSENGNGFEDLMQHVGHKVVIVTYGREGNPINVAIECEDCNTVLVDFNKPDIDIPDGITLQIIK